MKYKEIKKWNLKMYKYWIDYIGVITRGSNGYYEYRCDDDDGWVEGYGEPEIPEDKPISEEEALAIIKSWK